MNSNRFNEVLTQLHGIQTVESEVTKDGKRYFEIYEVQNEHNEDRDLLFGSFQIRDDLVLTEEIKVEFRQQFTKLFFKSHVEDMLRQLDRKDLLRIMLSSEKIMKEVWEREEAA